MIKRAATSRRNLLLALGAGGVGAVALASPVLNLAQPSGGGAAGSWWDPLFTSLRDGSVADWSDVVGQIFSLEGESGTIQARLAEVKLLPSKGQRPPECRSHAFSLVFQAALAGAPVGDAIYRLTHASYPPLEVYFSPAVQLKSGARLLAVFN